MEEDIANMRVVTKELEEKQNSARAMVVAKSVNFIIVPLLLKVVGSV